ncbi:hypothetical protein J6590_065506 [Homalodisca vitripennis]|nr:hypothetical protein J6590_065506 [Homalodisca vitripennis]
MGTGPDVVVERGKTPVVAKGETSQRELASPTKVHKLSRSYAHPPYTVEIYLYFFFQNVDLQQNATELCALKELKGYFVWISRHQSNNSLVIIPITIVRADIVISTTEAFRRK